MREFKGPNRKCHQEFEAWRDLHPHGFVLNLRTQAATRQTVGKADGGWRTGEELPPILPPQRITLTAEVRRSPCSTA